MNDLETSIEARRLKRVEALRCRERTPLAGVVLAGLDMTPNPEIPAHYSDIYGHIAHQLYESFVASLPEEHQEAVTSSAIHNGFMVEGAFARRMAQAYVQHGKDTAQTPCVTEVATVLKNSVDTVLDFAKVSNSVNKRLESQFGLKGIEPEFGFKVKQTDEGQPVIIADPIGVYVTKANAGYFDAPDSRQCIGQHIIRESWPVLIDAYAADPRVFAAEIAA